MPSSFARALQVVLTLVLLTGCAMTPSPPSREVIPVSPLPVTTPIPITDDGTQIAQAGNDFGFALFEKLHERDDVANVFISPLSIYLALALVYNGASGETADQMAQALEVQALTPEQLNQGALGLQHTLTTIPGVELLIANSTWVQAGLNLYADFATVAAQYYNAEAAEVDFFGDPDGAAARINGWVAEQTDGLIDKLITPADMKDVLLVLLNAIYFKGTWQETFDPAQTREQPFYLADGSDKTVPMMTQTATFPYAQFDTYDALALPYGDGRVRMVIVLPHEGVTLIDMLDDFEPAEWQSTLAGLTDQTVSVGLPRYQMEYEERLNDYLIDLGMPRAFTIGAEFDKLIDSPSSLFIEFVQHKALIQVDEEGTTAVAATAVGMAASEPPSFIVDRPFFFAIEDSYSGSILFMGAVYEPDVLGWIACG